MVSLRSVAPAKYVARTATAAYAILLIAVYLAIFLQPPTGASGFDNPSAIAVTAIDLNDDGKWLDTASGDAAIIPSPNAFIFVGSSPRFSAIGGDVGLKGRCVCSFHARGPPALTA